MYFLYHFVLEIAMHGRTPGKRMAGIHIVTREGGSPGIGALLTRNVFRLVDTLPLLYGVGLVATLATRDHVRVGDMAAGPSLSTSEPDIALPYPTTTTSLAPRRTLPGSDAEIVTELLQRWPHLESRARQRLATAILSRHGLDAATLSRHGPNATLPVQAVEPPSQHDLAAATALPARRIASAN